MKGIRRMTVMPQNERVSRRCRRIMEGDQRKSAQSAGEILFEKNQKLTTKLIEMVEFSTNMGKTHAIRGNTPLSTPEPTLTSARKSKYISCFSSSFLTSHRCSSVI